MGMLTGALWVVNLSPETFRDLPAGILASAPFLLGAFAFWGAAGGWSARQTDSLRLGILAAILAALICVPITITFGFVLAYTSLPHLATSRPIRTIAQAVVGSARLRHR
ncbi:MAG: hypothetical protein M3O77_02990 [Chloroflexota bacterium]|nr:hypothetical protein [Chloroflexota bacterium]